MKLLLTLLIAITTTASYGLEINVDDMVRKHRKTVAGCVGSIVIANLLLESNANQIGGVVCAGLAGYNYYSSDSEYDNSVTNKEMKRFIKESRESIIENHEVAKKNYSAYREVIRRIISDNKLEMKKMIYKEVEKLK